MTNWEKSAKITDLPIEAKIGILLHIAEHIDGSKDPDVQRGLKRLFEVLVSDVSFPEDEPRH